jgi:hypothetical protein
VVFLLVLVCPTDLLKKALPLLSELQLLIPRLRLSALQSLLFLLYIATYLHILLIKVGVNMIYASQ